MRRIQCQSFTRACPIPSGTASTMLYSYPNGRGKPSSGKPAVIWGRFFMGWHGRSPLWRLARYEAMIQRTYSRALADLERTRKIRAAQPAPASDRAETTSTTEPEIGFVSTSSRKPPQTVGFAGLTRGADNLVCGVETFSRRVFGCATPIGGLRWSVA